MYALTACALALLAPHAWGNELSLRGQGTARYLMFDVYDAKLYV